MSSHRPRAHDPSSPNSPGLALDPPGPLWLHHAPARPGTRLDSEETMLDHMVGLVGPEASGAPSLWLSFLTDDDRLLPVALPIDDLPTLPDAHATEALSSLVTEVVAEWPRGTRVLVAVVRDAGGDHGAHERRWAGALWRASETGGWQVRAVVAVGEGRARVLSRERCL